MVLDYIRKGAICTLLGLGALVSPAVIPCNISSVYAQEKKEEPKKQESRGLQELLSEEIKRLEDKEKTPDEYIRLAELYIDQREILSDEKAKPKLESLLSAIKGKAGFEFQYVNLLVSEAITGKRKTSTPYTLLFDDKNVPPALLSKIHTLYLTKCDDDPDKAKEHLQKALELDPSNVSAYPRLFEIAAQSPILARTLNEEYDFDKVVAVIDKQEMYFKSAIADASKLELLDCLRAKYKLLTGHSAFLEKAIECLTFDWIGKPHSNKYLQFRKKCVLNCFNNFELKLKILSTLDEYLFFTGRSSYLLKPGHPDEFEKQDQFRIIDKVIIACDDALQIYKERQKDFYEIKAHVLHYKAEIEAGGEKNWEASKLNSAAKKSCKDAIENYELALKYESDEVNKNVINSWIKKLQQKITGKKK